MKNKIVVYTALFGNYSGLIEQPKIEGVDFICYTDQDLKSKSWKIVKVPQPVPGDNTRSNRFYKILPHKHLNGYEHSVYLDANYLVVRDFSKMVVEKLATYKMLAFDHNKTHLDPRDCIYDEHKELVKMATEYNVVRDSLDAMQSQIDFLKSENYPSNNGLIFAAVLIRNHFDKEVIDLMELWWGFVNNKSKRDQLSFNYCTWKLKFDKINYFTYDLRTGNPWFYWFDHKENFNNEVKRIKTKVKIENIFGIKSTNNLINMLVFICNIPCICYLIFKIPFWYKKHKQTSIDRENYKKIILKIHTLKYDKKEVKNIIHNL